ncbi:hypothetical protein BG004_003603 [Podila humilis]|nr:hypothetical protein BG004_003603 [Podila humilis]
MGLIVLRLMDVLSARLGPIMLTLAAILLSLTTFCYFSVFIPFHYQPHNQTEEGDNRESSWTLAYITQMTWSLYILWGILANYYFAVMTPPGSVTAAVSALTDHLGVVVQRCICKHCPWIHNCVGHFNHRYFVMFLTYLTVACVYYIFMGIGPFMALADEEEPWPYWLHKSLVAFSVVLAAAFGMGVGGMCGWHWYLTLSAQTTLEQYNNNYMKGICHQKGDTFHNMYDFGVVANLKTFFNIGPRGPWYTTLLPLRIPPVGNGKNYEKSGRGFILKPYNDEDNMA